MKAFVISTPRAESNSVPPRISFELELENDSDKAVRIYALTGQVSIFRVGRSPTKLGHLPVQFMDPQIEKRQKTRLSFNPELELDACKLNAIEELRATSKVRA